MKIVCFRAEHVPEAAAMLVALLNALRREASPLSHSLSRGSEHTLGASGEAV